MEDDNKRVLAPVVEVSQDIAPVAAAILEISARLARITKPAPDSAQAHVMWRLDEALKVLSTAPGNGGFQFKTPPSGTVPAELASQVEQLIQNWAQMVVLDIDQAKKDGRPAIEDEAGRLQRALNLFMAILNNEFKGDLARHGANVFNVSLRTGVITFLLGLIHKSAALFVKAPSTMANLAGIGWFGLVLTMAGALARIAYGTVYGSSTLRSRVSESVVLIGMLAAVGGCVARGVEQQLASFFGTRVVTTVVRDLMGSQFRLSNNTRGLSWLALMGSGLAWALVNGLTTLATSAYDARMLSPLGGMGGNSTEGVEADMPAAAVAGSIILSGLLYGFSEAFDDWCQPTSQGVVDAGNLKKHTEAAVFAEQRHADMLKALAADAMEVFGLPAAERAEAVAEKSAVYRQQAQKFYKDKQAAGLKLTIRERAFADHISTGAGSTPLSEVLSHVEGAHGKAIEIDFGALPGQLEALIEYYAAKQKVKLEAHEIERLVEQFFVKTYILRCGYVPQTALMRDIEHGILTQAPGTTPNSLRVAVTRGLQHARASAAEGVRIKLSRYTGDNRLGTAGRAFLNGAMRRNLVLGFAFAFVFAMPGGFLRRPDADEDASPWLSSALESALLVFGSIAVIYTFFYSIFHTDSEVSTPNQVANRQLKSFHFDVEGDDSASGAGRDGSSAKLAGVIALSDLMLDLGGALLLRGGMADFLNYAWNSDCIFCEPPSPIEDEPAYALRVANTMAMYVSGNDPLSRLTEVGPKHADFAGIVKQRALLAEAAAKTPDADRKKALRLKIEMARLSKGDPNKWMCGSSLLKDYSIIGLSFKLKPVATTGQPETMGYGVIACDKCDPKIYYVAVFNVGQKTILQAQSMSNALTEVADALQFDSCELLLSALPHTAGKPYPTRDFSGKPVLSSILTPPPNAGGKRKSKRRKGLDETLAIGHQASEFGGVAIWGAPPRKGEHRLCHLKVKPTESPLPAVVRMLEHSLRWNSVTPDIKANDLAPAVRDLVKASNFALDVRSFRFDPKSGRWTCEAPMAPLKSQTAMVLYFKAGKLAERPPIAVLVARSPAYEGSFVLLNPADEGLVRVVASDGETALVQALRSIGITEDFDLVVDRPTAEVASSAATTVSLERHAIVAAFGELNKNAFKPVKVIDGAGGVSKPGADPGQGSIYRELQEGAECGICAVNALIRNLDLECGLLTPDAVKSAIATRDKLLGVRGEAEASYVSLTSIKYFLDAVLKDPPFAHATLALSSSGWRRSADLRDVLLPDFSRSAVVAVTYQCSPVQGREGLDHTVAIARDRRNDEVFYLLDSLLKDAQMLVLESGDMHEAVAAFCSGVEGAETFEFLVPVTVSHAARGLEIGIVDAGPQLEVDELIDRTAKRFIAAEAQRKTGDAQVAEAAELAAQAYWEVELRGLPKNADFLSTTKAALDDAANEVWRRRYVLLLGAERAFQLQKQRLPAALAEQVDSARRTGPDIRRADQVVVPSQYGGVVVGKATPPSPEAICFYWASDIDPVRSIAETILRFASGNRRSLADKTLPEAMKDLRSLGAGWSGIDKTLKLQAKTIALQSERGRVSLAADALPADLAARTMVAIGVKAAKAERPKTPEDSGAEDDAESEDPGTWNDPHHVLIAQDKTKATRWHILYPDRGVQKTRDGGSMPALVESVILERAEGGLVGECTLLWFDAVASTHAKPPGKGADKQ